MAKNNQVDLAFLSNDGRVVELEADPQPLRFRLPSFALVVVDMQNAFAKKGGMFDRNRVLDSRKTGRVIGSIQKTLKAAREAGVRIVYLTHVYERDLGDAGSKDSPNYWKEMGVVSPRAHPEFEKYRFLTEDSWDSKIIEELKPARGDLVVRKTRYSGFTNPELGLRLKKMNVKILGFAGVATNVCVESTLRDAYFSEYFPVLFRDACLQLGSPVAQSATVNTVRDCFGWITSSRRFVQALALS